MNIKTTSSLTEVGIRALSEDSVLVDEARNIFGVFDGASSLDAYVSPDGKTGGYIAANTVQNRFARATGSLVATALQANNDIEAAHAQAGIDTSKSTHRFGTTASVVRLGDDTAELLQVGDSVILTVDHAGQVAAPLGYHDHDLGIMRQWRKLADQDASNIGAILKEDMLALRESSNVAYGVLNGDPRVQPFTKTTTIELGGIATILLLTDGMYLPKSDPDAPEDWAETAELYKNGGLEAIYHAVRATEQSDPDLTLYPRYKLHDDASGVALELATTLS